MRGSRWNPRNPFGNCYDPKASQWLPIDGYDPEKTPGLYRLPKRDQASVKQYTVQPAPVVQSAPIVRSPGKSTPRLSFIGHFCFLFIIIKLPSHLRHSLRR